MPSLTPDFLANIPIFRDTSEEERNQLLQVMEREHYNAGDDVITAEQESRGLHVIVEGTAHVILSVYGFTNPIIDDGEAQIVDRTQIATLEIGAVFGEISFFDGETHTASVQAASDLDALLLPAAKFEELLKQGNYAAYKVGLNAAKILAGRLRSADKLISELILAQHDSLARSRWFGSHLELYGRAGHSD
ncbi:DNA-binding transcriptional dual regulator Crp [Planctomycetes bacterium Pan216]|uniref:DNA-binding transcriptional dual regulator Crp n=2 Tax=Kolteria novifilia TaxID=2527975 RepID=A0A518BD66_9BACT|nr:DNA-binding transcriptional dual regulator Crp [Planctomycetes bacterium Pan216]